MKAYSYILILMTSLWAGASILLAQTDTLSSVSNQPTLSDAESSGNPVYVIPIQGQIENGLVYVIRRGLKEAAARNAQAIIFDMDTPGGAVNSTEEICKMLKSTDIPLMTYVEGNAISAGAIIALTTHQIYMTSGSKIGDAMPIAMGQQLGEAEREKIESYVDGLMRSNCEFSGRNTDLGTAMVRRNFEFTIGDEMISPEGELLTLTDQEAARTYGDPPAPLLSEGTVEDFSDMMTRANLSGAEIVRMEVTGLEKLARFIAAMAPILMMVGMAGIYLEIQSPGIGLPAIVAGMCLGLFFFGHHIAGLAGMEEVLLFGLGVVLLLVEFFVLPGFGIAGFLGLGLILTSFLTSMFEQLPGEPILPTWETLQMPIMNISISLGASTLLIMLIMRYLPGRGPFRGLVLSTILNQPDPDPAVLSSYTSPVSAGEHGETSTDLHPAGTAMFGEHRLDVVTRGEYIEKNRPIIVAEVHGGRIVVEERSNEELTE